MRTLALSALLVLLSAAPAPAQPARFGFGYDTAFSVTLVPAGSPAARGGLRVGDRIVAVNGHDARTALRAAFPDYLAALTKGGAPAAFEIDRDGARQTVRVAPAPFETVTVEGRRQDAARAGVRHVQPRGDTLTAYPIPVRGDGTLVVDVPRYEPRLSLFATGRRPAPTLTGPDGVAVAPVAVVRNPFGVEAAARREEDSMLAFRWRVDAPAAGTWTLRTANEGAIQTGARLPPPLDCAEVAWAWDVTEPGAMPDAFVGERTGVGIGSFTPYLGPRLFGARHARVTGDGLSFDGARLARPPVGWGHVEANSVDWPRRADASETLTIAAEVARCLTPYLAASGGGSVELFDSLHGIVVRHVGPGNVRLGMVEVGSAYDDPGETSFAIRHTASATTGSAPACLSGDCESGTGSAMLGDGTAYTGAFRDGKPHGAGVGLFGIGMRVSGMWAEGEPSGAFRVEAPNGARWEGTADRASGEGSGRYVTSCGASSEGAFAPRWDGFRAPRCARAPLSAAAVVADVERVLGAGPTFEALRGEGLGAERWRSTDTPAGAASATVFCSDLLGETCTHLTAYRLPSDAEALALAFTAADTFRAAHPAWWPRPALHVPGLGGRAQAGPFAECPGLHREITLTVDNDDATLRVAVRAGEIDDLGFGPVACPR